jgi:hypothetical protein
MAGGGEGITKERCPGAPSSANFLGCRDEGARVVTLARGQGIVKACQRFTSKPVFISGVSDPSQTGSKKLNQWAVIRVEQGGSEKIGCVSEVAGIEHEESLRGGQLWVLTPVWKPPQRLTHPREVNRLRGELADERYHGTVRIKIVAPQTYLWEGGEKGVGNDVELFSSQLIER